MSEPNKLFTQVPDRSGTNSLKWGKYFSRDIIPLWVADMDFKSPPEVIELASKISSQGNFGYGVCPPNLNEVIIDRTNMLYDWPIAKEWMVWLPGMVCGLNVTCRAFEDAASQVITNTPVYPPFLSAPGNFGLPCTKIPMSIIENRFTIDFEKLSRLETNKNDLFMLCHPHNPVGTCFTQGELARLSEFILERELFICSDEIHCDLILKKNTQHIPFASLSDKIAARTITLMAPSKTFNLPGFGFSFAVISNGDMRRKFKKAMMGIVPDPPAMGFSLAEEAYRTGEPWRVKLIEHLRRNRDFAFHALSKVKGLSPYLPEATYLMWLDASGLGLGDPHSFFEDAGVGLSNGRDFGAPGYLRLNLGCTPDLLKEAITRMQRAVSTLNL